MAAPGIAETRRIAPPVPAPEDPSSPLSSLFAPLSHLLRAGGDPRLDTRGGLNKYGCRAIPDPEVRRMVRDWAAEADIPQRDIPEQEIVDRCVYALVNEGAHVLEEGFAMRAVDIDIIYINGYGFPAYRGGPMWYADAVGLKNVFERVSHFHRTHGELWTPAPLLRRLAEEDRSFADFSREQDASAT